jgi:hypothetical protein
LDAWLAKAEAAHFGAQIIERRRLGEGGADHLAAGEIDAEVQPLGREQADGGKHQERRDRDRDGAPAQEIEVGAVRNELQQAHMRPLRY